MTSMLPRTTATNGDLKLDGQDVHKWLMDLGWDSDTLRGKYPTKYTYDPNAQEQFKLIVRDYARMEAEKDQRQYGSLQDALSRLEAGRRVEPRWGEMMKLLSGALELGEYTAMCGSAALYDTTRSPELRNGYLNQVEDEVRHTTQVQSLSKYFASQYNDPAGFTDMRRQRYINPLYPPTAQAFGENFVNGDPVWISLNLQLVAEACFTNPLIVAMTEWAAANGDEVTPTVFLSIQSDEMRHARSGQGPVPGRRNRSARRSRDGADLGGQDPRPHFRFRHTRKGCTCEVRRHVHVEVEVEVEVAINGGAVARPRVSSSSLRPAS
ncbi:hypothetical protein [Rhodococcus sp. IEGM 27]|uniref:hypothetical protein n=1 Tax=Rhodococcus sp. IEGM 27 TaxID=3082230 RepID=UPI002954B6E0|nr:hypothetical protein [Rhodococcus sp. IEGM 27]MDV8031532.1 hypothetical protein [Rhodococcus sp. IEGM 27]